MRPLEKNALVILLAGMFAAASLVDAPSVLCVGSNGHVAIESGRQGGCSDGQKHEHEPDGSSARWLEAAEHPEGEGHCGSCADTLISNDWRSQERAVWRLIQRIALGAALGEVRDAVLAVRRHPMDIAPRPDVTASGSPHLPFLRTVIILS